MTLQELVQLYSVAPSVEAFRKTLGDSSVKSVFLEGLVASSFPVLFSAATSSQQKTRNSYIFILPDEEEAGYFYHDLKQISGGRHDDKAEESENQVMFFPSSYRRAIKYAQRDSANEILRAEVLSQLSSSPHITVVTYPAAIAEQVISKQVLSEQTIVLKQGQTVEIDEVAKKLREFGFQEVDYVYEPGQFAQRGSILDVYSFSSEYPFRIDFFGDDIDTIRTFEVDSQLSRDIKSQVSIIPELSQGQQPLSNSTVLSFFKCDAMVIAKDFSYVHDAVDHTYQEANPEDCSLIDGTQLMAEIASFRRLEFGHRPSEKPDVTLSFHTTPQPLLHKNFELLRQSFADFQLQGYHLYILADSHKQLQRLQDILQNADSQPMTVNYVDTTIHAGFVDHDQRMCVFTDHEIFDRFHKYSLRSEKARSGKAALTLKEIQQFEIGDYVVHVDHGIGKFGGLVRMPIQTAQPGNSSSQKYQEMIKIIYQGGGSIYVSIHSLYKVSKYKAQDNGEPPRLSQLGTGQWERLKERTKNKLKDIARDLIKLYAARKRERGFAFSADTFMQHELEASFLYEDTPDQLKVTNDVKADMEQARPMDRLVCGDVGFGKTEVAVRAAFKAACDSKQVAVLVPTTVLAYQHYQTFKSRLKDLPVRVDYLTRARTAKQTKDILQDLADGKIDIIIGTHKLIGKTVKFKDLGLLIIDEEQKFGVSTKEKLRQMKTNVDTLTLTATPIPRTLQFSLLGARDLSIINTPPPNRIPVQTEIILFDKDEIKSILEYELNRNGQIFFLHNKVEELPAIYEILQRLVPDMKICMAHGKMESKTLENRMLEFMRGDYDMLLCTTIIENGLDIPNANTIIINQAQNIGLSDLHQLRGRVGRSNRKAFCYLIVPPLTTLTDDARRRLKAIEEFSDLGSGFNIAMQDLDIRGAGNLLGAEQSGFIMEMGYETYQKILSEAMEELGVETGIIQRGSRGSYSTDCTIETDQPAMIPDDYIDITAEKIRIYKHLDSMQSDKEIELFAKQIEDRFGNMPQEVENLFEVVKIRNAGAKLGFEKIIVKNGMFIAFFISNQMSPYFASDTFSRIIERINSGIYNLELKQSDGKLKIITRKVDSLQKARAIINRLE